MTKKSAYADYHAMVVKPVNGGRCDARTWSWEVVEA